MRSRELISALLHQFFVESADLQDKEEAHSNVLATEDLHETKEHVPLNDSRKGIQMLRMIKIGISGVAYIWCGYVRGNSF